jgi:hypothetical protein
MCRFIFLAIFFAMCANSAQLLITSPEWLSGIGDEAYFHKTDYLSHNKF